MPGGRTGLVAAQSLDPSVGHSKRSLDTQLDVKDETDTCIHVHASQMTNLHIKLSVQVSLSVFSKGYNLNLCSKAESSPVPLARLSSFVLVKNILLAERTTMMQVCHREALSAEIL